MFFASSALRKAAAAVVAAGLLVAPALLAAEIEAVRGGEQLDAAPVVTPVEPQSVNEGELLELQLTAFDREGADLTWYAKALPAGVQLDASTGLLRWIPSNLQAGSYVFKVGVSDGAHLVRETFTVTVGDVPDLAPFVATWDGTRIGFGAEGSVTEVRVGDQVLGLTAGQAGGLFVEDYTTLLDGTNLLANGSFEEVVDGTPAQWSVDEQCGDGAFAVLGGGFSGTSYVELSTANDLADCIQLASAPVSGIEPGTEYIVHVQARSPQGYFLSERYPRGEGWADLDTAVVVRWLDDTGALVAEEEAYEIVGMLVGWSPFNARMVAPEGATSAVVVTRLAGRYPNHIDGSVALELDDVRLLARPESTLPHFVPTAVTQGRDELDRNTVVLSGVDPVTQLDLELTLVGGDLIRGDATVTNVSEAYDERVFNVGFALPIDALGFTWHQSYVEAQVIDPAERELYRNADKVEMIAKEPLTSVYPFATIDNGVANLSLGLDLQTPVVFQTFYDTAQLGFGIHFSTGISPHAATPDSTRFDFVAFAAEPAAWGMRAALERFYALFPERFELKTFEGQEFVTAGTTIDPEMVNTVADLSDYEAGITTTSTWLRPDEIELFEALDDAGIFSTTYSRANDMKINGEHDIDGPAPTYADLIAEFESRIEPQSRYEALSNSLSYDWNGNVQLTKLFNLCTDAGTWGGRFALNAHPDSYAPEGQDNIFTSIESSLGRNINVTWEGALDGLLMDGAATTSGVGLDYAPEHIALSSFPLTWNLHVLQPAVHTFSTQIEFAQRMSARLEAQGRDIHMIPNLNASARTMFFYPHMAAMGYETHLTDDWSSQHSVPNLAQRRALAHHRPAGLRVTPPCEDGVEREIASYTEYEDTWVRPFFNRLLLFGIHPSVLEMYADLADDNDAFVGAVEAARPLHQEYMPVFRALTQARWEPVTHAELVVSVEHALKAERFGPRPDADAVYFVVHNADGGAVAQPFSLLVDLPALGIADTSAVTEVVDLLSGEAALVSGSGAELVISGTLELDDTRVFRVTFTR